MADLSIKTWRQKENALVMVHIVQIKGILASFA